MVKVITILLIGLVLEAVGVVLLSKGLHEIGEAQRVTLSEVSRVIARGATNRWILFGVLFEALFFAILIYLLSQRDVSLIWPLTSLGFVITALAAKYLRAEEISGLRWTGVALIVVGAALIAWSEQARKSPAKPPLSERAPVSPG